MRYDMREVDEVMSCDTDYSRKFGSYLSNYLLKLVTLIFLFRKRNSVSTVTGKDSYLFRSAENLQVNSEYSIKITFLGNFG